MKRLLILALACALARSVWAHGGEDHAHPSAPAPVTTATPRMSSATEQFEMVGVLEGKRLTIYLDQFGSNTPVAKAHIEVESGAWKAVATEIAPAVYAVSADLLAQPGRHPITFTVQWGDAVDLMEASLDVAPPGAATSDAAHARPWRVWAFAAGALALALTAMGMVIFRQRKQRRAS